MKKKYINPQLLVVNTHPSTHMLVGSDPQLSLGSGEIEEIETKQNNDWNIWE